MIVSLSEPILEMPAAETEPAFFTETDRDAFLKGDKAVFEKIFRELWPVLYRAAHRILLDHDDAEEAAQEGFVKAHRARSSFKGTDQAALAAWMLVTVRRTALDMLRRKKRRAHLALVEPVEDPVERAESSETCLQVRLALAELEPADRAAIVLFEVEEMPQSEIAGMMELTVGALKVRLHRARRKFREAYMKLKGSDHHD